MRQFAALGIKPYIDPADIPPPFPEPLAYLWDHFLEIMPGVQPNGWNNPVITWECLEAWSRQTGQRLEPREARAIVRLSVLRANILNESMNKQNGGQG